MRTTINGIFFKAISRERAHEYNKPEAPERGASDKAKAKYEKELEAWKEKGVEIKAEQRAAEQRQRDDDARRRAENEIPRKDSQGLWYRWVDDGRGGYPEYLSLSEQIAKEWESGR